MTAASDPSSCAPFAASPPAEAPLEVVWLGSVPYADALRLQLERVDARRRGACRDALLLLEHPPVITLGRSARRANVLVAASELRARRIAVHEVSRGGDVTYHAPGQLIGYLVADLAVRGGADVSLFLRTIEGALVCALAGLGIAARRIEGMTGVFIAPRTAEEAPRKIASIGVGLRGWVSYHGFALNVSLDLSGFDAIVPCGLHGVTMTSVARETTVRAPGGLDAAARSAVADAFRAYFP